MFGFSEFLDFLDILGRYYNTFYVDEQIRPQSDFQDATTCS